MQQQNQHLLPPENPPISQTPSTSHDKPMKKEKPQPKKQKNTNIDALIDCGNGLLVLVHTLLILIILISITKNSLKPAVKWEMNRPAQTFQMDDADFLVSSTSETCNELVRLYMMHHDQTMALEYSYIFLVLCLDVAEPHRSSQAGNNYLVKVDAINDKCYYLDGVGSTLNLTEFRPFIEVHREAEYIGPKSIMDPAAFRVVEDFIARNEDINGNLIVLHMMQDLSTMRFPMTKQLHKVITKSDIENTLLFQSTNSFEYLFHPFADNSLVAEGELMGKQKPSLIVDRTDKMVLNRIKKFGRSDQTSHSQYNSQYAFMHSKLKRLRGRNPMIKIPGTNYQICSNSNEWFDMENRSITSLLVEYASKSVERKSEKDPLNDIEIYKKMYGLLEKNFPNVTQTLIDQNTKYGDTKFSEEIGNMTNLKAKTKRKRPRSGLKYEADSFVILDRQRQTAIAYISSLGTPFGSFVSLFGSSDIANNMMYKFAQFWEEDAIYQHLMDPMIITKGKKIHIAYAGQGARFRRSLDVVRRFFSLIFTLFHDVQLDLALTTPLIYPLSGTTPNSKNAKTSEHTNGFPWVHVNEIRHHFSTDVKAVPNAASDIVTAIYGNEALYFDGNNGVEIQPNGI